MIVFIEEQTRGKLAANSRQYCSKLAANLWQFSAYLPRICRKYIYPVFAATLPRIFRVFTTYLPCICRVFAAHLPRIFRLFTAYLPRIYRVFAAYLQQICRIITTTVHFRQIRGINNCSKIYMPVNKRIYINLRHIWINRQIYLSADIYMHETSMYIYKNLHVFSHEYV
jgi:hypothetical protein